MNPFQNATFHLKVVFFCQNVNLSYTYSQYSQKNPFMIWKWSNYLNISWTWFKLCDITCEMAYYKFHKGRKSFQSLLKYIFILKIHGHMVFLYKHIPTHHNIKRKIHFLIYFLGWIMLQYNMQKHNMKPFSFDMVRLKDMLPKKTLQCDYTKEVTIVWFHPSFQMHLSNVKDNKRMNTKDITILNRHNEQDNNKIHQKNTNQKFGYGHKHRNKQLSSINKLT